MNYCKCTRYDVEDESVTICAALRMLLSLETSHTGLKLPAFLSAYCGYRYAPTTPRGESFSHQHSNRKSNGLSRTHTGVTLVLSLVMATISAAQSYNSGIARCKEALRLGHKEMRIARAVPRMQLLKNGFLSSASVMLATAQSQKEVHQDSV